MPAGIPKGPCKECEVRSACPAYPILHRQLFNLKSYKVAPEATEIQVALDQITSAWIRSVRKLIEDSRIQSTEFPISFSALFDLCASALYANALFDSSGRFLQAGVACGNRVVFPYTWMCPICVEAGRSRNHAFLPNARFERIKGDAHKFRAFPNPALLAKPRARAIGDVGIAIIKSILRALLPSDTALREGGGRRGEFDLTITSPRILGFVEVKAKPLIAYPLIFNLSETFPEHRWVEPGDLNGLIDPQTGSLFLGALGTSLRLDWPYDAAWPLLSIKRLVADPDIVNNVITNWTKHLRAYQRWKHEPDNLRWHRFGCGNFAEMRAGEQIEYRVANTKELPGLDRTDDIKKGTAQLLLFSRFKFQCKADALRTLLIGNLYAETHSTDYLEPLVGLRIANSVTASESRWLYDAVIGFSRNHFNAADVEAIFNFPKG